MSNQGFEVNFNDIQGANKESTEVLKTFYDQPGYMRDVCFVWLDGRRVALSYADMISKELTAGGEIIITLSTGIVMIKGYNLALMHTAMMKQRALYVVEKKMNPCI